MVKPVPVVSNTADDNTGGGCHWCSVMGRDKVGMATMLQLLPLVRPWLDTFNPQLPDRVLDPL